MSKNSKGKTAPAPHYADWEVTRDDGGKITVPASALDVQGFHAGIVFTDASGVTAHFADGGYRHVLRVRPERPKTVALPADAALTPAQVRQLQAALRKLDEFADIILLPAGSKVTDDPGAAAK